MHGPRNLRGTQPPAYSHLWTPLVAEVVDVYDARDAIEACGGLWGEERETCFAVFGVAPEADLWMDIVLKLEMILEMDTREFFERLVGCSGQN